jgi:hypothetical protein
MLEDAQAAEKYVRQLLVIDRERKEYQDAKYGSSKEVTYSIVMRYQDRQGYAQQSMVAEICGEDRNALEQLVHGIMDRDKAACVFKAKAHLQAALDALNKIQ